MAKNNSPLNYSGSWAHHDAEEAKEKYAEGDDAWAHALGKDEHAADFGKWSGTHEARYSGDGKAKYSSSLHMWESASQIGKHMSSNLWGEAKRELTDDPLEEGLTGQRASAMPQKEDVPKRKHARIDVDGDGIYDDAEAGEMYYDRSQVYDESGDVALGKSPDMKNLPLNSPERLAEYKKRGWALDETVHQPGTKHSEKISQKEHPTKPKEKPKGRPAPKDFPG